MSHRGIALLAWRFLTAPAARRRGGSRRLVGAIVGVALSMVPLVMVQQVAEGMIAGIAVRFIETGTYHLQAISRLAPGPELEETVARLASVEGVTTAVPERRGFGLLYAADGRSGVSLRAVPQAWWEQDPAVRELIEVQSGRFDLSDASSAVLGQEIARRLGVAVDDEVRLLTARPAPEGRILPRISRFRVAGIVSTGYRDLDRLWVFLPYERGRQVIADETATDLIGVKLDDPLAIPNPLFNRGLAARLDRREERAATAIVERVSGGLGPDWFLVDWYAAEQGRYLSFLTSRNLLAVVMAMIVLVAVVNISSALVLLVVEKEQDIAILRACGVGRGAIARTFVAASLMIGLGGAVLGLVAGLLAAVNINPILRGIEGFLSLIAGRSVSVINPEFYLATIPVEISLLPAMLSVLLVLLLSLLAALIPARRASAVPPDRILRGRLGRRQAT